MGPRLPRKDEEEDEEDWEEEDWEDDASDDDGWQPNPLLLPPEIAQ